MSISEPFIRRPIATSLMMLGVLVFGIGAYNLLPVAALPKVDFPTIAVTANFPGASTTDMQTSAPQLYALLTGRVSQINRSVILDETTKQYGSFQPIVRNRQREFGF